MKNKLLILSVVVIITITFLLMIKNDSMKITLQKGRESTLVCFGDSLTAGTGGERGKSYPDHLANYLNASIVNSGVPGDTTESARKRFERDVLSRDPDIVIIQLGANDYFAGIPIEKTQNNIEYMIDQLEARKTIIFIARFFPEGSIISFLKPKDNKKYNKIYESLVSRDNVFLIEDIWGETWGTPKYMSDRVHPNSEGYEIMAKQYYKSLKPLFKYNKLLKEDF